MASSLLDIANGALMRLGAKSISALTELTGRANLCNQWVDKVRKQTLRSYPWNCAIERRLLDTFPNATLTPSAVSGDGVTFMASANVFVEGRDENARIVTSENAVARIQTVEAANEVTADIETELATVAALAPESWRIAPAWEWQYRYIKPDDYLRVTKVSAITNGGQDLLWSWWSREARDNSPEPVRIEGQSLVSNVGPQILVQYTKDLTDVTRFDPLLDEAVESLLAFRICYGVTGSLQAAKTHHDAWKECLAEARTMDGQEGTSDDTGSDVLLAARF